MRARSPLRHGQCSSAHVSNQRCVEDNWELSRWASHGFLCHDSSFCSTDLVILRSESPIGIDTELCTLADCPDFGIHRFFGAATTSQESSSSPGASTPHTNCKAPQPSCVSAAVCDSSVSNVALVVDVEMGCEESCHKISAMQHHLHIYEVKTTVTIQQRDRRTRISSTNLISISLTCNEANTFVIVFCCEWA